MAAMVAASPMLCPISDLKSPLRNFKAETCDPLATEEVYADAQARLVQWRKDVVNSVRFEAQQGLRELCYERDHLNDLQADLAGVQSLVKAAAQLQAGGARLAEVLHNSSQTGAARAQAVARINGDLRARCEKHKQDLQHEERSIMQHQSVAEAQHAEALKLLAIYQERLGLTITREASQTVRIAFSYIDEANPTGDFFFTLGLASSETGTTESYCVHECMPQVPELSQALAELNRGACSNASLPRFVCIMRRAFLRCAKTVRMP